MNPAADLKRLQRLRDDEKYRRDEGVFLVEGDKAVREFTDAGRFAGDLYATPDWPGWRREAAPRDVPLALHELTPAAMARVSHLPSPSSVLAVLRRPGAVPPDPAALRSALTLALDAVQDPGNVGTIIRIADWFGCGAVLLGAGCADPYSQKTVNASKGSLARVPVHRVGLPDALAALAPVPVLGCDLDGESVHALPPLPAAVVVIGSEGRGLSAGVAARLTRRITIPSFGGAESLNAAVAAAIVCDNLRRPR